MSLSRRDFLKIASVTVAGLAVLPETVLANFANNYSRFNRDAQYGNYIVFTEEAASDGEIFSTAVEILKRQIAEIVPPSFREHIVFLSNSLKDPDDHRCFPTLAWKYAPPVPRVRRQPSIKLMGPGFKYGDIQNWIRNRQQAPKLLWG